MVIGVIGTGGMISVAVSGFQTAKRSRSLEISSSWLWCAVIKAYLIAHERNLRVREMRYLGFGSEWGLANIRVDVLHNVTNDFGFFGCIHHSM